MDLLLLVLAGYVLLIRLPVDWVLSTELTRLDRMPRHWIRAAILRQARFRVVPFVGFWMVEGRALWLTPYQRVVLTGAQRGLFTTREQAEVAVDCVEASITRWLKGN